ncbi:MAG TPA: translation elongation factor Ts [Cyclobacteriaceae bacterium]
MGISAKDVNKLRQMTGAGMMDCKKALVESDGDFDKAIELLRKKGQKVSASRADRETSEGIILVKTSEDKKEAIMISLTCETDFVAKNDEFVDLGEKILDQAFTNKVSTIDELKALKLGDLSIEEKISELIGKIGEKIEIKNLEKLTGETVVSYIHGSKIGVLVGLKNVNGAEVTGAGRDVAMQIAAMRPVAVDKDGVDKEVIEQELQIGIEQAKAEGKPENMLEKIAQGKLNKFFKENTLLSQPFVKDNSMNVGKYLDSVSKGLTVEKFIRITIG